MKLFYCPLCKDMVSIRIDELRFCACRKSYGQYKGDGSHAEMGGWAIPFGISNAMLLDYVFNPKIRAEFDEWLNLDMDGPVKYDLPFFWRKDYNDGSIDRMEL